MAATDRDKERGGEDGVDSTEGGNEGAGRGWRRREGKDRREERHEAEGQAANRTERESNERLQASSPRRTRNPASSPHSSSPPSPSLPPPSPSPPSSPFRPHSPASTRSGPHHSANTPTSALIPPSPPDLSSPSSASPAHAHHPPSSSSTIPTHSEPPTTRMQPRALLPSLYCPLCSPPALLRAPVTLHCGHSFCAAHFPVSNAPSTSAAPSTALVLPSCPLQSCSYSSRDPSSFARTPPLDVTVNKVIDIIVSLPPDTPQDAPQPPFHDDQGNCTGTEDEEDSDSDLEYLPLPPLSPESNASHPTSSPARESGAVERVSRPDSPRVNARHHSRPRSQSSPRLRPRKRRRRLPRPGSPPPSHPQLHRTDHDPCARVRKELLSELTCEICFGLLWQPVTTPCQHTFCTRCLFRSLDHSQTCPLCRQNLPGYDYFQQHPCNKVILAIILKAFPDEYAERGATIEAEERDARLDTPIFVCQLSFPGIPTMLHFFEPRYRLMLRRCLDSPHPCFGMIPPPRAAPSASTGVPSTGNDYGTMLAIRNVRMYPDGRSLVETWGTWRFRIMERGTLDGYMVARVERIEDYEEELDESAVASAEPNERSADDSHPEAGTGSEINTGQDSGDGRSANDSEEEQVEAAVRAELGEDVAEAQTASPELSPSRLGAISSIPPSHDAGPRPGPSHDQGHRSGGGQPRASPGDEQQSERSDVGPVPAAPSPPAARVPTNAELMDKCRAFVEQMRAGTPWVVEHLDNNFVPMPNDAASFSFWMALLLPIDEHEKAKLLPIRSPRLRLRLVVHWIEQLNNNWARAYASASAWQVVLWRVRRLLVPPRPPRFWALLAAYAILLAAIYRAQAGWHRDGLAAVGESGSVQAAAGRAEL